MIRFACAAFITICLSLFCHAGPIEFVVGDRMAKEGGNWSPESSPLKDPFGVDFDSNNVMYIVELGGGRVHRLNAAGKPEVIAGDGSQNYSGDGGPAKAAQFNGMHNCVITKEDQLLIADSWNHCVRKIDLKSGEITTIAGTGKAGFSGDGGPAKEATFNFIMCIELSHDESVLHITDLKNHRIRNMDLKTHVVSTVAGNGKKGVPENGATATEAPLVDPRSAASDVDGNLYVLERGGNALRVVHPDGTIHTVAGTGQRGFKDGDALSAQLGSPKHICCDPSGNVYIADDTNGAIRKYDPKSKQVSTLLGRGFGDPKLQLKNPHGVRWHAGLLYVVDMAQNRILKLEL